jgi:hypothetical protein
MVSWWNFFFLVVPKIKFCRENQIEYGRDERWGVDTFGFLKFEFGMLPLALHMITFSSHHPSVSTFTLPHSLPT